MDDSRRAKRFKRRLIAAAILLAVLAYPASEGPANYAAVRGWISGQTVNNVYGPVEYFEFLLVIARSRAMYVHWWQTLGLQHDPPYAIEIRDGERVIYVASDSYLAAAVDRPRRRIYIAGRWMFMTEQHRVIIEDSWTNQRQRIAIPADSQRVEIAYFDDRMTIEVDGNRVDISE